MKDDADNDVEEFYWSGQRMTIAMLILEATANNNNE